MSQQESKLNKIVIHPENLLIQLLNYTVSILIISQSFMLPYLYSFEYVTTTTIYLNLIIDLIVIFSNIVNSMVGYYDNDGEIEMEFKAVFRKYIKEWLFFDLVTSFPYSVLIVLTYTGDPRNLSIQSIMFVALLRVFRLFKIPSLINSSKKLFLLEKIEEKISSETIYNISAFLRLIIFYLLAGHFLTCLWLRICSNEFKYNEICFMSKLYAQDINTNSDIYISIFYFIMVCAFTTGFGDMVPITTTERLYSMFIVVTLYAFHTYLLTEATTLAQRNLRQNLEKRKVINSIKNYFIQKNADVSVLSKVYEYLLFYNEEKDEYEVSLEDIYSNLNDRLKKELKNEINKLTLLIFRPFKSYESVFTDVTDIFFEDTLNPTEELINQGEPSPDRLFFVQRGSLICYNEETSVIIGFVQDESLIGELGFFTGQSRICNVVASTFVSVLYLVRSQFLDYLKKKGAEGEKIIHQYFYLPSSPDFNYNLLDMKCYYCKSATHLVNDCEEFVNSGKKTNFAALSEKRYNKISSDLFKAGTINKLINRETKLEIR